MYDAVTVAASVVEALARRDYVEPEAPASAAHALARAMAMMRGTAGHTSDVRASYMQASRIRTRGSLVLTGHGVYNVDAEVGGDVLAQGAATVRGGTMRVGGRLPPPSSAPPAARRCTSS